MSEYVIENLTIEERLLNKHPDIEWYPDDVLLSPDDVLLSRDIVVHNKRDAELILKIIGRKTESERSDNNVWQ